MPLAGIDEFMPLVPLGDVRREGVTWPPPLLGATLRGGGAHTPTSAAPLSLPPGVQLMTSTGGLGRKGRGRGSRGGGGQAGPFGQGARQPGRARGPGLRVWVGGACLVVSYDLGVTHGSAGVWNRRFLWPRLQRRASAMQHKRGILCALGWRQYNTWGLRWGPAGAEDTDHPHRQSGLAGIREGSGRAVEALSFRYRRIPIRAFISPPAGV